MKAFVAGATGETGRRIVAALVERQIPVRALVRDQKVAQTCLPSEVDIIEGDLSNAEVLKDGLTGCTVALSAVGARPDWNIAGPYSVDYEGTRRLIDQIKTQEISHFVLVSSLCVSQFFHPLNLFWLVLFWKKQAELYLQQSGVTYTIIRPGGLLNEDNTDSLVMSGADTLFEGRIPRDKVAQVCVEALMQPAARNKTIEIVARPDVPALDLATLFASISAT